MHFSAYDAFNTKNALDTMLGTWLPLKGKRIIYARPLDPASSNPAPSSLGLPSDAGCSTRPNYSRLKATAAWESSGMRRFADRLSMMNARLAATLGARSQTKRLSRKDYTSVDIIKSW